MFDNFCVTVCDFCCTDERNAFKKNLLLTVFPSFSSKTVVFRAVNLV